MHYINAGGLPMYRVEYLKTVILPNGYLVQMYDYGGLLYVRLVDPLARTLQTGTYLTYDRADEEFGKVLSEAGGYV